MRLASSSSRLPSHAQLGALGLGTVLFQFAVGFFAPLIIATTPRVAAAHAESRHLVRGGTWLPNEGSRLVSALLLACISADVPSD